MLEERLLDILEQKNHWAWPWFSEGRVPLPLLLPHFQQEWEVYVRDFPLLLARVLGHQPPQDVCAMLAENIYEEQTGGISKSAPHPELFLRMMEGCGFPRAAFENVQLLPGARAYRAFLDQVSWSTPWVVGAAVLTIFVEGSARERSELAALEKGPQTFEQIEEAVRRHPLVRIHGLDPKFLELQRVHKLVEGGHRRDAWNAVLGNVRPEQEGEVERALQRALSLWLAYRDGVAAACGITR
jgi:pyrroloquinoline quinone (PQQ) biosynthesis protein C